MNKSTILSGFNKHFFEFAEAINTYFPENIDVKTSLNALYGIKKVNPKLIIKIWHKYVVEQYQKEIAEDNFSFFITKDYVSDVNFDQNDRVLKGIENLRRPLSEMPEDDQNKCMQYVKNLATLSNHYFS